MEKSLYYEMHAYRISLIYMPQNMLFQLQNLLIKRVAKTLHNSKGSPSKLNFYKAYLIGDDILNKRLL